MTRISVVDRLRIERVVWSLDQQLYDLPTRVRVAARRDVRGNLLAAADDVGTGVAIQRLGAPSTLAQEYLSAEYGDRPRPSWMGAAVFLLTTAFLGTTLLSELGFAFRDGLLAAQPKLTGTFAYEGLRYLQTATTFTAANGTVTQSGGALTPLAYLVMAAGAAYFGKLWRLRPRIQRRATGSAPARGD